MPGYFLSMPNAHYLTTQLAKIRPTQSVDNVSQLAI